jgi:hypothetical protein
VVSVLLQSSGFQPVIGGGSIEQMRPSLHEGDSTATASEAASDMEETGTLSSDVFTLGEDTPQSTMWFRTTRTLPFDWSSGGFGNPFRSREVISAGFAQPRRSVSIFFWLIGSLG